MNMIEAMRDTVALMERGWAAADNDKRWHIQYLDKSLQPEHLRDMLQIMESGNNPQHPGEQFSESKMGRWLGWAQAAVTAMGFASLDEMKATNKRWSK